MTMTVSGPGGLSVQFPDGTPRDTIDSVMAQAHAKQNAAPAAPAAPSSSAVGSAFRGARDTALLGWGDELAAGAGVVGNYLGRALGVNKSTASLSQTYHQLLDQDARQVQADQDQHPTARLGGQAAGLVTSFAAPGVNVAKGANLLTKAGVGAAHGAVYGAVSGAGNAAAGHKLAAAGEGGVTGAAVGGVLAPVVSIAGKVVGPAVQDFVKGGKEGVDRGIAALSRRVTLDPQAMADKAAQFRAAGIPPTLTDVVTPQARTVISAAGGAADNGQKLVDQATTRAVDVQDRVADQARANIAGGTDTAATLEAKLTGARKDVADDAYTAARNDPLPLTPELKATLATAEGQNAIRGAIQQETDPAARAALAKLGQHAMEPEAPAVPPELAHLGPAAQQQAMEQMGIKASEPPPYTAGMADKISKVLFDAADSGAAARTPRRAAVLGGFGRAIREHAAENSPAYAAANQQYANMSRPIAAIDTGSKFMGGNAGGAVTPEVATELAATQAGTNPLTQSAAKVAARDQVVEAAGKGPQAALATADKLSVGANQGQRSAALLGQEAGDRLAEVMGLEAQRVRNATAAAPGAGGKNLDANAADIDAIMAHAATGGHSGLIYAMRRFLSHQGMSNVNARQLVDDATNPARVDAAIAYLGKRMGSARAKSLVGSLARVGGNLSGQLAGAAQ